MTINATIDTLLSNENSSKKAYATVEIDEMIKIHDVKVVDGKNGLFASLPQRTYENKEGKLVYRDVVTCNDELKKAINTCVVAAYQSAIEKSEEVEKQEAPFDQAM